MDIVLLFLNSTSHQHINPIITHFIILSLHTSIPSFIQSNNIVIFILSHIHFIQQTIINILSLHIITPPSTHSIIHILITHPYNNNLITLIITIYTCYLKLIQIFLSLEVPFHSFLYHQNILFFYHTQSYLTHSSFHAFF